MSHTQKQTNYYSQLKIRWRHSLNQLSKLQQQSKLTKLDTIYKKSSQLKIKMKNRLGQIDDDFNPQPINKKPSQSHITKNKCKLASTNHDTNILTTESYGSHNNLQQSVILSTSGINPQQTNQKLVYNCDQIRQQLFQELTQFNKSKYETQMKQHCSKYNQSFKSIFYRIIDNPKQQIYQFCYNCDQILNHNQKNTTNKHICKNPLTSISKVQQALFKIKSIVDQQNNKIFHVFLHNAIQPQVDIEELITNVNVLKQSIELKYEPQQAVLRMRLMNLIGKKIGLLIEQKQLQDMLKSICKSKK